MSLSVLSFNISVVSAVTSAMPHFHVSVTYQPDRKKRKDYSGNNVWATWNFKDFLAALCTVQRLLSFASI